MVATKTGALVSRGFNQEASDWALCSGGLKEHVAATSMIKMVVALPKSDLSKAAHALRTSELARRGSFGRDRFP